MAPRYGGGAEEFNKSKAALEAISARLADVERKEIAAAEAAGELDSTQVRASRSRTQLNRAKKQGEEITARESAVSRQEAAAVDVDTAAIERNRVARERRAAAARQEAVDISRALRGAQDPLLGRAGAIQQGGGGIRQYRQQLGVGYSRARALEDALTANFRPAPRTGAVSGAATRAEAAREGVVRAEVQYEQARKAYTSAVRRGAEEEALELDERRAVARTSLAAAKAEEEAALAQAEARQQAAAVTRETSQREAAVRQAEAATGAGTTLQRRYPFPGVTGRFYGDPQVPTLDPTFQRLPSPVPPAGPAGDPDAARSARLRQMAQEQAALGNVTNAQAAYNASLSTEQRAFVEANRAQAEVATGQISQRTRANALAFEREGAALGSVSQAMYKHGALTQEFIMAAARGETTLRELGNQALVTAGKFGGWTIAATAVFGVVEALGQVVTGAKEAQTGTANLARFVPHLDKSAAVQGYVQQSQELNVPIQDVASAQSAFARVFRDQDQALTAARVSILAYKLDQISAADSQRFFTGIVQEWGLAADQLPDKFDQISRAQRVMGARVAETLPSIARSSAAVKNAGGDLNQLIALAATAQVASGQTGNVVGTAFTRAASNFSRNPNNREVIRSLGINPDQGFTQMLIEAVRKASSLTGDQRTELAKAIGGPQYGGRIFQTLLGQQRRLSETLRETSPAKSQGSAMEELHDKLRGVDEQVAHLGVSLQDLGAELGQAGALDFAGGLLRGLNEALHIAVQLGQVFNDLPAPVRMAVTYLGEALLVMKAMRRFLPESLAGSAGGRVIMGGQRGQDQLTRTRVLRGLRETQSYARNEAEQVQRRANTVQAAATRAQLAAEREVTALNQARVAAATGDVAAQEQLVVAETRVNKANARSALLARNAALAADEAALAAEIMAAADARYAEAKGISAAELRASAILPAMAPRSTAVPNAQGVERIDREGGVVPLGGSGSLLSEEERAATAAGNTERKLRDATTRTGRLANRFPRVAQSLSGFGGAMRNVGSSLREFEAGLGIMEYGFAALIIGQGIIDHLEEQGRKANELQDELNARRDTAAKRAAGHQKDIDTVRDHPFSTEGGIAAQDLATDAYTRSMQERQRRAGRPVYLQTYDQLVKQIQQDQRLRADNQISQREFDKLMAKHAEESKHLADATEADVQRARAAIAAARRAGGGTGYAASLRALDDKGLAAEGQAVSQQYGDLGRSRDLRHLRAVYRESTRRFSKGDTPADVQALGQARQAYFQALQQSAQTLLALRESRTGDPLVRARLSVDAARVDVQRARRIYGVHSNNYRQALANLNNAQQAVGEALLANVQADNNLLLARAGSNPVSQANAAIQAAQNTLRALKSERRANPNDIKNARADLIRAQQQRTEALKQQADEQRSDAQDIARLQGELAVARAGDDPVLAARIGVRNARAALRSAHGRKERLQAMIDLVTAQNQLEDALKGLAEGPLRLPGVPDRRPGASGPDRRPPRPRCAPGHPRCRPLSRPGRPEQGAARAA
jgi:hypothetical protein